MNGWARASPTSVRRQRIFKTDPPFAGALAGSRRARYVPAMKTLLALFAIVGLTLSLPAQPYPPGKGAPKAGAKGTKKEEKEEPKIEGIEIPRANKTYLGLQLVNGAFKMTFYDQEKKPTTPDVARAALRWDAKYKVGQERIILNPGGDPNSLTNPKPIRPPYTFKLFITLLKDSADGDNPVGESFVIDFRQ
jgi:hypothetical protein